MSEHEEEHQSDRVDEAEPVSLRDIEMIFAPGKPPPPRRAGSSPSLPEPTGKEEPPKPPRPPRKAAAPPDIGASDLAAFAAMGSLPPPREEDEANATPPPPPVDAKNAPTEPPPSEGRRRARVVPKLRKPLTVSFSEAERDHEPARPRVDKTDKPETASKAANADDWDSPPDSGLRDLRALASVHPPAPRDSVVDADEVLALRNEALEQALQAPQVPPDLASMVNPTSGKVHAHAPPPRPKNKTNSDAVVSALTAPPGEPQRKKKKKKGPSSSRAPGPLASEGTASTRPSAAPKKTDTRAPAAAKEESASKWPLYALVAAALFGGGYFVMRGSSSAEPPKRDQTPTPPVPTAESKPAQATPMPQETAKPPAPVETEAPATAAPTATASAPALFGKMPTATATADPGPVPSTKPTAEPKTTPSATPAAQGGGFDKGAATAALGGAVGQASGCKQPGDPSGTARVQVTFAPSGRVTVANISGPPFAGTATGGCIARAFKTASVPPFEGDPVTVSKTVEIP